MMSPSHMRGTVFRRTSVDTRTSRLASVAATGTFLDHLPCSGCATGESTTPFHIADVGVTIQLLTLRPIDGERALETEIGIPAAPGADPAERFLLSGGRLLEATRRSILNSGPDGARLDEELFDSSRGADAQVRITELVSLQRRWGAASNGLASGSRTGCRIQPGVVLLGALCVRAADLTSLATLFAALDRAAAHGLPAAGRAPGACQLDVLAIVGGALDTLPSVASLVHGQENRFGARDLTRRGDDAWAAAPFRLEGRDARRAASQVARVSSLNPSCGRTA